jgi:hypothetical protein
MEVVEDEPAATTSITSALFRKMFARRAWQRCTPKSRLKRRALAGFPPLNLRDNPDA